MKCGYFNINSLNKHHRTSNTSMHAEILIVDVKYNNKAGSCSSFQTQTDSEDP